MPRSLFVVHGALGSAEQMSALCASLSIELPSLSVHPVELPGHGRTPLTGDALTMPAFTEALHDVVSALAVDDDPPLVVGYSMGGYVALLLEAMSPGTFAGIVTLGTMLEWTPAIASAAGARLDPFVLRAKVPTFASALDGRHAAVGGADVLLSRTAALLRSLGDAPPLTATRFASIRCPVVMLVGERDDSVDFAQTQSVAALMARGTAVQLAGVPHPIEKVPASAIADAVRAALTSSARP